MLKQPITLSLSPNTEKEDVISAIREIITPWNWFEGKEPIQVVEYYKNTYNVKYVGLFNSGRSALFEILKAFNIKEDDEVIVQSFTCVAVPNALLWVGAKPVYADIDETYNLNIKSIQKVVTQKTRAIIVQHTFGIPAEIDKIIAFAQSNNILVIEDCAHAMGARFKGKLLGTFGDASFFSFGRDKVLSSVFGGVGLIRTDKKAGTTFEKGQSTVKKARYWWVFQQLLHPIAMAIILPCYSIGLGKIILVTLQKLHLLSFPVYSEEKQGEKPNDFPSGYPHTLIRLALLQLKKLDRYNEQRRSIVMYYRDALKNNKDILLPPQINGSIYLRFPVSVSDPDRIIQKAKKQNILLGNWYHCVIDPKGVSFQALYYKSGSCPNAESLSKHILNLPTRITMEEAKKIVSVLQ